MDWLEIRLTGWALVFIGTGVGLGFGLPTLVNYPWMERRLVFQRGGIALSGALIYFLGGYVCIHASDWARVGAEGVGL